MKKEHEIMKFPNFDFDFDLILGLNLYLDFV